HRSFPALASGHEELVASASEPVVRDELGDTELRDGELLSIGVEAAHHTLSVDGHAGELARGVTVLALGRDVRLAGELGDAVETRRARSEWRTEIEGDRLGIGAREGHVRRVAGHGGECAVRVEGQGTRADL